jgi:hypothetical protein
MAAKLLLRTKSVPCAVPTASAACSRAFSGEAAPQKPSSPTVSSCRGASALTAGATAASHACSGAPPAAPGQRGFKSRRPRSADTKAQSAKAAESAAGALRRAGALRASLQSSQAAMAGSSRYATPVRAFTRAVSAAAAPRKASRHAALP